MMKYVRLCVLLGGLRHLDQNELQSLPDDAFEEKALRGLKHLWLANNVFSSIPRAIRKLTNLHTL